MNAQNENLESGEGTTEEQEPTIEVNQQVDPKNEDPQFIKDLAKALLKIAEVTEDEITAQEEWHFASREEKEKRANDGTIHDFGLIRRGVDTLTGPQKQMHHLSMGHNVDVNSVDRHGKKVPEFGLYISGFGQVSRFYLEELAQPLPSLPTSTEPKRNEANEYTEKGIEYVRAKAEITQRSIGVAVLRRAISAPEILEAYPQLKKFAVNIDH